MRLATGTAVAGRFDSGGLRIGLTGAAGGAGAFLAGSTDFADVAALLLKVGVKNFWSSGIAATRCHCCEPPRQTSSSGPSVPFFANSFNAVISTGPNSCPRLRHFQLLILVSRCVRSSCLFETLCALRFSAVKEVFLYRREAKSAEVGANDNLTINKRSVRAAAHHSPATSRFWLVKIAFKVV